MLLQLKNDSSSLISSANHTLSKTIQHILIRCPIGYLLVAKPAELFTERLVQTVSENPQGTGLGPYSVFILCVSEWAMSQGMLAPCWPDSLLVTESLSRGQTWSNIFSCVNWILW